MAAFNKELRSRIRKESKYSKKIKYINKVKKQKLVKDKNRADYLLIKVKYKK